MTLPSVGFGEIIMSCIYIVATHYFVKVRVKEEFSDIKKNISEINKNFDKRCDELEFYLRRLEAVTENNRNISESNSSLLKNSVKLKQIIDKINETDFDEKK